MKLFFVVNPISGGVDKEPFLKEAKKLCELYGHDYHIFKTTGKEILSKGWRIVFEEKNSTKEKNSGILPNFMKGEKGPHEPSFLEKQTKPPNQFTEASLLRAMETAGKQVDDDENGKSAEPIEFGSSDDLLLARAMNYLKGVTPFPEKKTDKSDS